MWAVNLSKKVFKPTDVSCGTGEGCAAPKYCPSGKMQDGKCTPVEKK
jgi:hypothetical protein